MQFNKFLAGALVGLTASFATMAAGLPGMRGLEHVGISVANLDEAVLFFVNVLGCEEIWRKAAGAQFQDDWMRTNLNVNPRAEIRVYDMIRCGPGSEVEMFEYKSPDQAKSPPKNSDIGGHHLASH